MNKQVLLVLPMVALLAMGLVAGSYAAQAGPGPAAPSPAAQGTVGPPPGPSAEFGAARHHRPDLAAMLKKLGITDEQKKQIRALHIGFRDRTRKGRTDLMSLMDEKKTMLQAGKVDQQRLAQIDDQIVKLRSDILKERLKLRRDRLALLTPEQLGRIADWQAEKAFRPKMKRMHRGERRGEFGG